MSKEQKKTIELVVFSILQYVFLPVLCGFLTAGILTIAGLEKLGVDRFGFTNFPTIQVHGQTWSNYGGLRLSAGLGCIVGMLISRFMRFGARLGHFAFISPPMDLNARPIPSPAGLLKSIVRLAGIPTIVVLAAVTALRLTENGMIPGVILDKKARLFEVTSTSVIVVAAVGCLLMFVYDMVFTVLLRMTKRKEVELKEFQ